MIVSDDADSDLTGIIDYTTEIWGYEKARAYVAKIDTAIELLSELPRSAPRVTHAGRAYIRKLVGSHVVIARADDQSLTIIRILHQRMDAPRHLY